MPPETVPHPTCLMLLPLAVGLGHRDPAHLLSHAPIFSPDELQSTCSHLRSAEQELAEKYETAVHSRKLRTSSTVTEAAEHLGVHNI